MKKVIFVVLSVLVVSVLLVSCTTGKAISDEELERELSKLSPEDLDKVIEDAEGGDTSAFAGQAFRSKYSDLSPELERVSKDRIAKAGYKLKLNRNEGIGFIGCTDTDSGKNYDLKGKATGPWAALDPDIIDSFIDRCAEAGFTPDGGSPNSFMITEPSGTYLQEYFCRKETEFSEGVIIVDHEFYKCPGGCENGRCVSPEAQKQ